MPRPQDVGVGIASILFNEKGEILLGWRKKNKVWSFPGGWVEKKDKALLHAGRRETFEEVGITIRRMTLLRASTEIIPGDEHRSVTLWYYSDDKDWHGDVENKEPEKHSDWKFFDLDALPTPLMAGLSETVLYLRNILMNWGLKKY